MKYRGNRVLSLLLALSMIVSLLSGWASAAEIPPGTARLLSGGLTLDNNGYPWGSDMTLTAGSFNLNIRTVSDPSGNAYQWQYSDDKEAWTDISGATEAQYKLTAPVSGRWYRCVVSNGGESVASKALETIFPSTTDGDVHGRIWTFNLYSWFLSNGHMAYRCDLHGTGFGNGGKFYVFGEYHNPTDGKDYMLQTSYAFGGWRVYSVTDANPEPVVYGRVNETEYHLDEILFTFRDEYPHKIYIGPDMEAGYRSMCVLTDAQLGSKASVGDYSDTAALQAVLRADRSPSQISMVAAQSLGAVTDETASIAVNLEDIDASTDFKFALGRFRDADAFTFAQLTSPKSGYSTNTVVSNGKTYDNVVTVVEGVDSGFAMSWMNQSDSAPIWFSIGAGSVKEAEIIEELEEPEPELNTAPWKALQAAFDSAPGNGNERKFQLVKPGQSAGRGYIAVYTDENGVVKAQSDDIFLHIAAGKNIVLDLNGNTIDRNLSARTTNGYALKLDGALTLEDSAGGGYIRGGYNDASGATGGGVYVGDGGQFTMDGGAIAANRAYYGGGVYVESGGAFVMNGGEVSGNDATWGGGVASNGTFTLSGGGIVNNNALLGAGLFNGEEGVTEMSGGAIANNDAGFGEGGGVANYNVFTMSGGAITGNTAESGGGVVTADMSGEGLFAMTGGSIYDNTAESYGGGVMVYADSVLSLSGSPDISENTADGEAGNVYLEEDAIILIADSLSVADSIGVTTEAAPTAANPVVITDGMPGNGATSDFFSENPAYEVQLNSDGEAVLALPSPELLQPPSANALTYHGAAQTLITAGRAANGALQYRLGADGAYSATLPAATDAGSYTVYYKVVGEGGATDTPEQSLTVKIAPKPLTDAMVTLGAASRVYNGETQTPGVTVKDGSKTLAPETDYALSGHEAADAGDYAVTVTGTGNYTGTVEKAWAITPAAIAPSITLNGWTYGDAANTPKTSGNAGNGKAQIGYKLRGAEDEAYSSSVPTDAGEYVVRFRVDATANYQAGEASANFTIAKRPATVTASDQSVLKGEAIAQGVSRAGLSGAVGGHELAAVTLTSTSTDAPTDSGVITPSGAKIVRSGTDVTANYTISYENGVLSVDMPSFPVTFYADSDGTTVDRIYDAVSGSVLSAYAAIRLENDNARTFAGWSLEKGVTEYNDGKGHIAEVIDWETFVMPEEALSVYPVWVENQLNVRLDLGAFDEYNTRWWYDAAKYDAATPAHMDATQGRHFWEKSGAFVEMDYMKAATRPGYTLDGWFTQSGLLWDANWPLDPEYCDRDENGNTILLEDTEYRNFYYTLTLTARWTPEPVKVEIFYDLNGGEGNIVDEATYVVNDLLTVSDAVPTPPENQFFVGWLDKAGNLYQPGDKTIFASEDWITVRDGENVLLLTAQYEDIPEPDDVTITFNTGGGSMTPSIVGKPGENVTAPENPTRIGYTFAGWSPNLPDAIPNEDMTVSAKWTPNRYTISFDAGRGSAVSDMTYEFGASVQPPADPTLTGYTFAGWDSAFPETMPAQDLSFKAVWTVNSYTISFDADGGEAIAPITAIYGARVSAPTDPVRDGYVFNGWNREIPSTMPAQNLNITAQWLLKPSAPDAPPAQAVSPTSIEVNPAIATQEYSIDGGATWVTPTDGKVTFDGLTPATEYAVITRIAETPTSVASKASAETKVTTPKQNVNAPDAPPAQAVSPTSIEVNPAIATQEYSIDGGATWVTPTDGKVTFDGLNPATEYAVITRIAETPTSVASDMSPETKVTTPKQNVNAPDAPPAQAVSPTSVEVNPAIATQEYSIDGGKTWVTPTSDALTFDGLTPATEYAVITRIRETPTSVASEASAATNVTTPKQNVNAPSAPPAQAVSPTSVEVNPAIATQEYSIDDGATWVTPTGDALTFDGLTPATEYAVITRIAETPTSAASDMSPETKVTTPKQNVNAPDAPPAQAVSPTSVEVNPAIATQEYSIDGGATWVTPTGDALTFDGLTPATEYAVITRIAETPTSAASDMSPETKVTTPKQNQDAPTGLTTTDASDKNTPDGSIVGAESAMEYSADGGASWTPVTETPITGLLPGPYLVRYAETSTLNPSPNAAVTVGVKTVVYALRQNPDGTWSSDAAPLESLSSSDAAYQAANPFEHFHLTAYSVGAYADESGRTAIRAGIEIPLAKNQPLYLYYARDAFTITFYADTEGAEVLKTENALYEAPLSAYKAMTLENTDLTTFAGWSLTQGVTVYNDGEGHIAEEIDWDNLTMPADALRVYPMLIANYINVRLDPGADDVVMDATQGKSFWATADFGVKVRMNRMNAATRPDYVLDGWYTSGGTRWEPDYSISREYCDRDADGNVITRYDEPYRNYVYTLTLTAKWTIDIRAKVVYDLNGGSGNVPEGAWIPFDGAVTVSDAAPTPPDNQIFVGWLDSAGILRHPGDAFPFSDTALRTVRDGENVIALTAQYVTPKDVMITFDTDGGSAVAPITLDAGAPVTPPANPVKEGYTFIGWEPQLPDDMPVENLTVKALWRINQYTLTFDVGPGATPETLTQDYGTPVSFPDPAATGYQFAGWNPELPATMPAKNLTLKAKWNAVRYTITFDTGDGTPDVISGIYGEWIAPPENPVRDGYTFKSWDREIPASMPAENLTITALWLINQTAPDAPDAKAVSETAVTVDPAYPGQEYSIDGGETWVTPTDGGVTFDGLTPDTPYEVITRIEETETRNASPASEPTSVTTWKPTPPDDPTPDNPTPDDPTPDNPTPDDPTPENPPEPEKPDTNVYAFQENADGTWNAQPVLVTSVSGKATAYRVTEAFADTFYHVTAYSVGAYAEPEARTAVYAGQNIPLPDDESNLYLYYARDTFDLTFCADSAGDTAAKTYRVRHGADLSGYADETVPAREGYTFAAWASEPNQTAYADENGVVNPAVIDWNAAIMPAQAMRVYPLWVKDKLNVRLDLGAYDAENRLYWYDAAAYDAATPATMNPAQSRDFDMELGERLPMDVMSAATRVGYRLDGWYTQYGVKWDAEWGVEPEYCTKDADGNYDKYTNDELRYDVYAVTLTARWTPLEVGVTYDGAEHVADGAKYRLGDTVTLADAPTPPDGMTFIGWLDKSETLRSPGAHWLFSDWNLTESVDDEPQIRFTAQYIETPDASITFDTDGGTAIPPITLNVGDAITPPPDPVRIGYTFLGWEPTLPDTMPDQNLTVTARWRVQQFTITFRTNGGSDVAALTRDYGAAIDTPANPVRENYAFRGWNPALPATMPAQNLTVDAVWEPISYTITFDANGGAEIPPVSGLYGARVTPPENPTRDGYLFRDWFPAVPTYMPSENLTVTARWLRVPTPPAAPVAEALSPTEIRVPDPKLNEQYSIDGGETWLTPDGNAPIIFDGLTPNQDYEIIARTAPTESDASSEASPATPVTTPKLDQNPPAAPPARPLSSTVIVISPAESGQEYSIDDGETWLTPDENEEIRFENLTPDTEYPIIARWEETDRQNPSPASEPTTVRTESEQEPEPDDPTPDNPAPDDPTPDNPTPDDPTPDDPTPDNPTPDDPTPDNPTPDAPTPDNPTPDNPTLDVSAQGWSGPYDGLEHSITVSAPTGYAVTYSETQEGTYSAQNPAYRNAGQYRVYFRVARAEAVLNSFGGETAALSDATLPERDFIPGSALVSISRKDVTVSGISARDKMYDGGTDAELDFSAVRIAGLIDGDEISVTATGTFDTPEVGNGKTVAISHLAVTGAGAANYRLAESGQQSETTASILARNPISGPDLRVYAIRQRADGTWGSQGALLEELPVGTAAYRAKEAYEAEHFRLTAYSLNAYADESERVSAYAGANIALGEQTTDLYLYYARDAFELVFYADGEGETVAKTYRVLSGASLSAYAGETLPEREGYTFGAWADAPNQTSYANKSGVVNDTVIDWDAEIMPAETKRVYPIWVRDRLNVRLDLGAYDADNLNEWYSADIYDDATKAAMNAEQSRDFDADLGEYLRMDAMNAATRVGYRLVGWYTQDGVKWDESWGVDPEYCTKDANGEYDKYQNAIRRYSVYAVILTARWEPVEVGVVYDLNGGAGTVVDAAQYKLGDLIAVADAPQAPDNMTFIGWRDANGDLHSPGENPLFSDWKLVDESQNAIFFTAQYIPTPEYSVTFDTDGGTAIPPITLDAGEAITPPNDPTKTGYAFVGWTPELPATMPNANLTVTALWEIQSFTITFNTNGGGAIAPLTLNYGSNVTAPANPAKTGYNFVGWTPELPATMPAKDLTVEAGWTPAEYTITFDANGGSTVDPITAIYGAQVKVPANPTRNNSAFLGWTPELPAYMPLGGLTVTAQWLDTRNPPDAPTVEPLTPTSVRVVNPQPDEEYAINGGDWTPPAPDGTVIFDGLTPNTSYPIIARKAPTPTAAPSDPSPVVTVTTPKLDQDPPQSPTARPTSSTSILVDPATPGQEYSIDGGENWLTPDETGTVPFTDLTPDTEYPIIARWEETDKQNPSAPSAPVKVRTNANPTPTNPATPTNTGGGSSGGGGGGGGGSSPQTYRVTVSGGKNGATKVSATRASKDTRITVTTTPKQGYVLDSLRVTTASGKDVEVTRKSDATHTFTMPAADVTVTSVFAEPSDDSKRPGDGDGDTNPDSGETPSGELPPSGVETIDGQTITPASPDETGVSDWLVTDEHVIYIRGFTDGTFRPNGNITRAQAAMMFYRLLKNQNVAKTVTFRDMTGNEWYAQAVYALASLGIIQGYSDGSFHGDRTITRAAFTAIAARFTRETQAADGVRFSDVSSDHWAHDVITRSAERGWIEGYSDGAFRPASPITRAAVTAIINRMLGRAADKDYVTAHAGELTTFSDVRDPAAWYYYNVMEAANPHSFAVRDNTEVWTDAKPDA